MKREVILLVVLLGLVDSLRLFRRNKKKKKDDKDGCDLTLGQKCELFEGGRHNCKKEDGLTCALFCKKDQVGDCQYWCVLKENQACSKDEDCLYEYCDQEKVCSKRKTEGSVCSEDRECFSFQCKDKFCTKPEGNPCEGGNGGNGGNGGGGDKPDKPDPNDPDPPIDDGDEYDSDNGKSVDPDPQFGLDLTDPDPGHINDIPGELMSKCEKDSECNDGVKAQDGTESRLACQQGKCRLKPGEFCYPGGDNLDYTCYNKNMCKKRFVLRPFKKTQTFKIYDKILEMTNIDQEKVLNQWNQKISRVEQLGDFDILDKRTPKNGMAFYLTYQCVVKPRYQCTDNEYCSDFNCLSLDQEEEGKEPKKMCRDKIEGVACEQNFECASRNCFLYQGEQTCQKKMKDLSQCQYNFECESHNCRRYKPTFFVKDIASLIEKECQPEGSLPLNAKCQKHKQCSNTEVLNDGTTREIGQLMCVESNIINKKDDEEKAIEAIKFFYANKDKGEANDEEEEDLNKNDEELSSDDLAKTIGANFSFKCKIPHNQACTEHHQCGFNSICDESGTCKGDENAFCVKKSDCKKGLDCFHNADKESPFYRRRICGNKAAENPVIGEQEDS